MENREVLNVKDVASLLGVSQSWVYHNLNEIPHRRIGGKLLFKRSSVLDWLEPDVKSKKAEVSKESADDYAKRKAAEIIGSARAMA